MLYKEGQFDVVELMVNGHFKSFRINLNVQYVNGMTPFDLAVQYYITFAKRVLLKVGKGMCFDQDAIYLIFGLSYSKSR